MKTTFLLTGCTRFHGDARPLVDARVETLVQAAATQVKADEARLNISDPSPVMQVKWQPHTFHIFLVSF